MSKIVLSKKKTLGITKLIITVVVAEPLIPYGELRVTLDGPEKLIAEHFVKSFVDSRRYEGFVTTDKVRSGTYTVVSVTHCSEAGAEIDIKPDELPSIEL